MSILHGGVVECFVPVPKHVLCFYMKAFSRQEGVGVKIRNGTGPSEAWVFILAARLQTRGIKATTAQLLVLMFNPIIIAPDTSW